jgi:hypothetical protein
VEGPQGDRPSKPTKRELTRLIHGAKILTLQLRNAIENPPKPWTGGPHVTPARRTV